MACPMAAGVAALLLQSNPSLSPEQIRAALTHTAAQAATPNNSVGSGLINALDAVRYATAVTLTVVSAHGGVDPGTITTNGGLTLNQWVTNSPLAVGVSTQYLCLAGSVAGNAYTQAAATNVTLTLTNTATLIWQWQTQYRLTALASGNGSVTAADGWHASGVDTALTATADAYWHFTAWGGDTNECALAGNVLTAAMTRARTVVAHFAENVAPKGTPEHWLAQYGLTNSSPAVEELNDHDGDGVPAWEEYVADTDPTNTASVLAFTGLRVEGTSVRLDWKGGQWARQYLDVRTNPLSPVAPWTCIFTNAELPTSVANFTIVTNTLQPMRFFRIRAER